MKARTRHASALLCAVALLATGPPAHARTDAAKTCVKPVGAATVHRDRYTVRYRKIIRSTDGDRVLYWACLRATGKRTRLTEATGKNDMAPILNSRFRSSRRFVAYVETRSRHDTAELALFAFDLRTGRRAAGIPENGLELGAAVEGRDGGWSLVVGDLAVSDGGGLAWHEVGQPVPSQDVRAESIKAHDATGTHTLQTTAIGGLQGPTITGNTVMWSADAIPRTYQLTT
jgi:hypothetical protein